MGEVRGGVGSVHGRPEAQSWSPAGPRSGGTWCHRSLAPVGVPAPPGRPRGSPARPLSRSAWTPCPSLGPSRPLPCAFAELLTRTPSPSPARPRRSPLPSRLGRFLSLSPADHLPTRAKPLTAENVSLSYCRTHGRTHGALRGLPAGETGAAPARWCQLCPRARSVFLHVAQSRLTE